MRRISRYILGELLKVFGLSLSALTLLLVLAVGLQEGLRQGLGPLPMLKLLPYVLPNALLFAVPGSLLFAVCSVYGSLSASNEILALKSLGIAPTVVLTPAVVLGILLSAVTAWMNDLSVSWGRLGTQRVVLHSIEEIVYGMLRTKRSYATSRFSINVKSVEGRKLVRPTFSLYLKEGAAPTVVTAETAELRMNPREETLEILITNSEADFGENRHGMDPGTFEYKIPLAAALRKSQGTVGPSQFAFWQLPQERQQQRLEIMRLEQTYATDAAYQMLTGDFFALADPAWQGRYQALQAAKTRLFRLETEPWRRWANAFSCLFFAWIGAPLAVRMRNADVWTTSGLCFLLVLPVYYCLMMFGVERAKSGDLPPYAVWLGNGILLAAGLLLIRRMNRY